MQFTDAETQNDFLQAVANVRRLGAVLLDWQHLSPAQLLTLSNDLVRTHRTFRKITDELAHAATVIKTIAEQEAARAPTEPPPAVAQ
jgi:Flp pilus assembly CpaE family ATPase